MGMQFCCLKKDANYSLDSSNDGKQRKSECGQYITSPSMLSRKHKDVCIYLQMGVVIMKQMCKMTVKNILT
jgi:hypothetical protein